MAAGAVLTDGATDLLDGRALSGRRRGDAARDPRMMHRGSRPPGRGGVERDGHHLEEQADVATAPVPKTA